MFFSLFSNIGLGRNKGRVLEWVFDFVNFEDNLFTDLKVHHRWDVI